MRLLYIGGYPRSGSTILSRLIGQVKGFADIGELANVWRVLDRGWGLCGCGVGVAGCPLWAEVLGDLEGWRDRGRGFEPEAIRALVAAAQEVDNPRRFLRALARGKLDQNQLRYGNFLGKLYRRISSVTGAETLVDSSKDPWWAAYAASAGVEVLFLHLVRDPRAVYHSRLRSRRMAGLSADSMLSTMKVAAGWAGVNVMAHGTRRLGISSYARTTYESIMSSPQPSLRRLLKELGAGDQTVPMINARLAIIRPGHTISGNPSRFQQGAVPLDLDQAWRSGLKWGKRATVMAVAGPIWWTLRRSGTTPPIEH